MLINYLLLRYCGTLNIIQVYAPIADKDNGVVESFYIHVDDAMKLTGSKDVTLLLGDMNAKIG